jgi:hypothetical protein
MQLPLLQIGTAGLWRCDAKEKKKKKKKGRKKQRQGGSNDKTGESV